jgi:hypothetical protein
VANTNPIAFGDQIKVSYRMYATSETLPRTIGALIGAVGEDGKPKTVKVWGGSVGYRN